MRHSRLVSALVRGPWLIDPMTAEQHRPFIEALLSAASATSEPKAGWLEELMEEELATRPYALGMRDGRATGDRFASYDEAPAGSVAVIPVHGVLLAEDGFCGEPGTRTLASRIYEADAHANIAGIVFDFDTPGGSVDGLEMFANSIAAAAKPTAAWVRSAYSAGYWSASGTDLIVLAGKTAGVGSIGTMITLRDYSARLAAAGVKEHIINASASTGKNTAYYAALQGDYAPLRAETLDPLNQVFLDTVSERRLGIPAAEREEVLSGKTFYGQTAIDRGLADAIGSLEYAAQRVAEMATTPNLTTPRRSAAGASTVSTPSPAMFGFLKLPAAAKLAGTAPEAVTPEMLAAAQAELTAAGVPLMFISTAQLEAPEPDAALREQLATMTHDLTTTRQDLAAAQNDLVAAQADLASATTSIATANAVIATLTTERDEARTQRDEYGAKAGVEPTSVAPDGDGSEITESASKLSAADQAIAKTLADQYGLG